MSDTSPRSNVRIRACPGSHRPPASGREMPGLGSRNGSRPECVRLSINGSCEQQRSFARQKRPSMIVPSFPAISGNCGAIAVQTRFEAFLQVGRQCLERTGDISGRKPRVQRSKCTARRTTDPLWVLGEEPSAERDLHRECVRVGIVEGGGAGDPGRARFRVCGLGGVELVVSRSELLPLGGSTTASESVVSGSGWVKAGRPMVGCKPSEGVASMTPQISGTALLFGDGASSGASNGRNEDDENARAQPDDTAHTRNSRCRTERQRSSLRCSGQGRVAVSKGSGAGK